MKIIGFTYYASQPQMVIKGDSSLLVNRKPFFIPDWSNDVRFTPALVLRVSRLGKNIEARFAARYYDAVAPAIDFVAYDTLSEQQRQGLSWSTALTFDYSLCVGQYTTDWSIREEQAGIQWLLSEQVIAPKAWVMTPEQAIEQASRSMTIRQGDLIYIGAQMAPQTMTKEQVFRVLHEDNELLYCKVK